MSKNFKKYDIVVDIDGVLLDIHQTLGIILRYEGYDFDISKALTYDFNKSLDPSVVNELKNVPMDAIFKTFENPDVYRSAKCDWDAIMLIRKYAEQGKKFLIYSLTTNTEIALVKKVMFSHWFNFTPNVDLKLRYIDKNTDKPAIDTRAVIEDAHMNLQVYDDDVNRYLIDKPYNQVIYNTKYMNIFNHPRFNRCKTTSDAIEKAIKQIALDETEELQL